MHSKTIPGGSRFYTDLYRKGMELIVNADCIFASMSARRHNLLLADSNNEGAAAATTLLERFTMAKNGEKIFEADNRSSSLFVELVYPNPIEEGMAISNCIIKVKKIKQYLAFVAIKNGEHDPTGYLLSNNGLKTGKIPLTEVYDILKESCLNGTKKMLN